MAKKQKPKYSYAPNMGLIAGEAQVAASETDLANVGQSFVTGAASVFGAIKQANAMRDARMDAYSSQLDGLVNANQFEDPKNKQIIKTFLNSQKDEFNRLAEIFDKTNDRDAKDKMEQIKFSLVNLNDQIKVFNQDKIDYITASDEKQLADIRVYDKSGDDFFTSAFTNNATFSIDEQGDILFGINNNSYKYKDKAGKWEPNDNIDETNVLTMFGDSYKQGGQGKTFNAGNVRRGLYNSFKNTGNKALQSFVTQNLVSDDNENDPNSGFSFEKQFADGLLKEKHPEMYQGFTAKADGTYDTEWMFENKNGDKLRNMVSDYFTKVMEDGHGQGRTDNYEPESDGSSDLSFGYPYVPNAKEPGKQIQANPTQARYAYESIESKKKSWQGFQGYYAYLPKSNKYVRYDDVKDYELDVENKKLAVSKGAWNKILPNSEWNDQRVISIDRVRELEGAFPMSGGGNKKYDK